LEASPSVTDSTEIQILTKLKDFYTSCMNEEILDERGITPLLDITNTIKRLYRGTDDIGSVKQGQAPFSADMTRKKSEDLTAAIAFVHLRGIHWYPCIAISLILSFHLKGLTHFLHSTLTAMLGSIQIK
jgi:hypothetical protein